MYVEYSWVEPNCTTVEVPKEFELYYTMPEDELPEDFDLDAFDDWRCEVTNGAGNPYLERIFV